MVTVAQLVNITADYIISDKSWPDADEKLSA